MEYGYGWGERTLPQKPCANCGKPGGGFMGSSEWGHDYSCCSDRCGFRLAKRIENGMVHLESEVFPWSRSPWGSGRDTEREERLRFRIKHLEKQLKLAGIKPTGTICNDDEVEFEDDFEEVLLQCL